MNPTLWLTVAVSFFFVLGNAQDGALPTSTIYATQGVSRHGRRSTRQKCSKRFRLRQEKALKAAMAAYSPQQQVITSTAQFLAANPPRVPMPKPGEGGDGGDDDMRRTTEVPEFDPIPQSGRENPAAVIDDSALALPTRKAGLFERMKSKSRNSAFATTTNATSAGVNPYAIEQPASPDSISNSSSRGATGNGGGLARFFGMRKRGDVTVDAGSLPAVELPDRGPGGSAGAPPAGTDLPGVAVAPVGSESSIFVPRQPVSVSGEPATLKMTVDADVAGVLVSLREGTMVGILSERGGIATIQLPDQRVGTLKSSVLAR